MTEIASSKACALIVRYCLSIIIQGNAWRFLEFVFSGVLNLKAVKKIIAIVLTVALCLGILSVSVCAKEKLNYLLLGDSIAEGFGITNPNDASYGKIVADTNGFNYKNDAVMGRNSVGLVNRLTNDEEYINDVQWADIISVSIGGNDFLLDHAALLIAEAIIFNDYSKFDKIGETFYKNFSKSMDRIHEINPDAKIFVQLLYTSWTFEFARKPYKQAAKRINDAIIKYAAENPQNIYTVDTSEIFDGRRDCISTDTIHPNAQGNIELAKAVQSKLFEVGLADTTELVLLTAGIDRNYLIEYFGSPLGQIIIFAANVATGNFNFA